MLPIYFQNTNKKKRIMFKIQKFQKHYELRRIKIRKVNKINRKKLYKYNQKVTKRCQPQSLMEAGKNNKLMINILT